MKTDNLFDRAINQNNRNFTTFVSKVIRVISRYNIQTDSQVLEDVNQLESEAGATASDNNANKLNHNQKASIDFNSLVAE